jgi:uncharacterized LabA/DUF88 family protein
MRADRGRRLREKGVDVALAVAFVTMAVQRQFDVGIIMSGDSDLLPALEFVVGLTPKGGPRAEIAAWRGSRLPEAGGTSERLTMSTVD